MFDSDRSELPFLGRAPLLEAAEEARLGRRALRGDLDARNALVVANVRLVGKIAAGFRGRGLSYADLIQEGILGLLRAAEKFDPRKGSRFSTYAGHWIRQGVMKGLADKARTIRLPYNVATCVNRVRRTERTLRSSLGREPELAEIAEAAGLSMETLLDLLPRAKEPRSLADPVGDMGDSLEDVLPPADVPDRVDEVARGEDASVLARALADLSQKERYVVARRFGLGDDDSVTLEEIAGVLGVSRERVRQIEGRALDKLRDRIVRIRRLEPAVSEPALSASDVSRHADHGRRSRTRRAS